MSTTAGFEPTTFGMLAQYPGYEVANVGANAHLALFKQKASID